MLLEERPSALVQVLACEEHGLGPGFCGHVCLKTRGVARQQGLHTAAREGGRRSYAVRQRGRSIKRLARIRQHLEQPTALGFSVESDAAQHQKLATSQARATG